MIKADGFLYCSRCKKVPPRGSDMMEGQAGTGDPGCLYCPDCHAEIQEEESRDFEVSKRVRCNKPVRRQGGALCDLDPGHGYSNLLRRGG